MAARQRRWLFGVAGAAWVALLLQSEGWLPPALCMSPMSSMPSHFVREWEAFISSPFLMGTLQAWGLMLAAMMLPLLVDPMLQLTVQSFPRRRDEARMLFLTGYALAWASAMTAMLALLLSVRSLGLDRVGATGAVGVVCRGCLVAGDALETPRARRLPSARLG